MMREKIIISDTSPECIQKVTGDWTEVTWREPVVNAENELLEYRNLRVNSYSPEQSARMSADVNGGVFAHLPTPTQTLDEVKASKRSEINSIRNALETTGFTYNGKMFDSDQRSADRIQVAALAAQAALMADQPFSIDWTTADNSTVTLDALGVLGMLQAFAVHGATLHETAKALKAQIDAATTNEEVEAISWPE
jgi:hypothetical protein